MIYQSGNKLYKLNPKSNDQASLFYSSKYHILKVEPREKELYLIEYYNAKEFLITELNNEAKITSQFKLKSADRITSVVKDKAGNFWCAGNRGLFKAIAWVEELTTIIQTYRHRFGPSTKTVNIAFGFLPRGMDFVF
ncbi:MAG: hypothetical protein IPQ10_14355 [Saprospiraceae bacterium]|nr:hypothetical protein [Saprospiraceae bacterium]